MFICVFVAYIFFAQLAQGQQRIATVENFTGDFDILHSAQVIKPIKIGKIIRNGDIFDSDTARTRDGEADLLLVDGSSVRMDKNTTLYLAFEALPATPGKAPGEIDRKIRLIVGRIWCEIKPSRTTTTKFELPDGVAAVRGTKVEFYVSGTGTWEAGVDTGVMSLNHTGVAAQMSMSAGNKLGVGPGRQGGYLFSNLGTGSYDIVLADGSCIIEFDPTEIVEIIRYADGSYRIIAAKGSFRFTDAAGRTTTVNEGTSTTTTGAPGAPAVPAGGAEGAPALPRPHLGGGSGGGGGVPASPSDHHDQIFR